MLEAHCFSRVTAVPVLIDASRTIGQINLYSLIARGFPFLSQHFAHVTGKDCFRFFDLGALNMPFVVTT